MVIQLPEWLVRRLYGDSVQSDTFYEDFMVKLVWRLSGGNNMANQIVRQSPC